MVRVAGHSQLRSRTTGWTVRGNRDASVAGLTLVRLEPDQDPLGLVPLQEHKTQVVPPLFVDVQVALSDALGPKSQLLHHSEARYVLSSNVDLKPVQVEFVECMVARHRHCRGRDSATGEVLVNPVADVGRSERTPRDPGQRHLTHEFVAVLHSEG